MAQLYNLLLGQYLNYAPQNLPINYIQHYQAQQTSTYFVPVQQYPNASVVQNYENSYNDQKNESDKLKNIVINKNNFKEKRRSSTNSGKTMYDPEVIVLDGSGQDGVFIPFQEKNHIGKRALKRLRAKTRSNVSKPISPRKPTVLISQVKKDVVKVNVMKGLQIHAPAKATKDVKDRNDFHSSLLNAEKVKTLPVVAHFSSANLTPSSVVDVNDFIKLVSNNYGRIDNMNGTFMCNETMHCKKVFHSATKFDEHIISEHAQTIAIKDLLVNIESYYHNMNVKDVKSCKLPALVTDENNNNFCSIDLSPEYEKYIEMRVSKRFYCKLCHNFYSSQDLVLEHLSGWKHAVRDSKNLNNIDKA